MNDNLDCFKLMVLSEDILRGFARDAVSQMPLGSRTASHDKRIELVMQALRKVCKINQTIYEAREAVRSKEKDL